MISPSVMPVATKKAVVAGHQVVGAEHAGQVVAGFDRLLPLVVVGRPEPALDDAAHALERGRGDDSLRRAPDTHQQVYAGAGPGRHDGACDVAVDQELHPGAGGADLLDQLVVTRAVEIATVTSSTWMPLALATSAMFSPVAAGCRRGRPPRGR
jgi:hypothetical protein